jgi:hypothetical protein
MRPILLLLAVACLALTGCAAGSSLPPATDSAQGREALKTVLDTWKKGGTIDELKTANPPITVRDPDWSAGAKLASYEIAPEEARAGVDLLLTVKLVLAPPDGPPREKKVAFKVAVGSSTVVLRNE